MDLPGNGIRYRLRIPFRKRSYTRILPSSRNVYAVIQEIKGRIW